MKIEDRYGTALRVYDNGGKTLDRYTILPPRWAKEERRGSTFNAIGTCGRPFHPLGVGMHCDAQPGHHLGKRIHWDDLPKDAQKFARQSFPKYAPEI